MAQKRMFDKRVVESDKFTDLPNSSKALYFMAGMSADDKGFFQPRRLQKMCGFTDDDFKILLAKGYFLVFESGVMVVTDWNKNNWLDSRRVTETEYTDELKLLKIVNEKYELDNSCLANAKQMLSENSIEKNSIEYNKKKYIKKKSETKKYGEYQNVFFTDEQYQKLLDEFPKDYEQRIQKLDYYMQSKGIKYKDCLATIRNWARKEGYVKPEPKKTDEKYLAFTNDTTQEEYDLLKEVCL